MPRDELVVKIGGDTEGLQKAAREGKAELDRFKQSSKEAAKVIESVKTPTEKYAAEQRKLNALFREGKITQDQHSRAMKQAKDDLDSTGKSMEGAAASVGNYLKTLGLAAVSIGVLREGVRAFAEEAQRGVDSIQDKGESRKALIQISGGSQKEFDRIVAKSDSIRQFGMSQSQADQFVFDAASQQFLDSNNGEDFQVAARATQFIKPGAVAQAAKLRNQYAGTASEMTMAQAISSTQQFASGADKRIEEIVPQLLQAGELSRGQGVADTELGATVSVLSRTMANAGARINAFIGHMSTQDGLDGGPRLSGTGLLDPVRQLAAMTPEERKKIIGGNKEVKGAYEAMLASMSEILAEEAAANANKIMAARGGGVAQGSIEIAEGNAGLSAIRRGVSAKGDRDLAAEPMGLERMERQRIIDIAIAGAGREGKVIGGMAESAGILDPSIQVGSAVMEKYARLFSGGASKEQIEATTKTNDILSEMKLLLQTQPPAPPPVDGF